MKFVNQETERVLSMHVIEPVQTGWASPIVFAQKKDDMPRSCIEHRKLNTMTIQDWYPIPRMD